MHEAVSFLDEAQEERVMREQLEILQRGWACGRPATARRPGTSTCGRPTLLKRHGFLYDSSLMGDDVPYTSRRARAR